MLGSLAEQMSKQPPASEAELCADKLPHASAAVVVDYPVAAPVVHLLSSYLALPADTARAEAMRLYENDSAMELVTQSMMPGCVKAFELIADRFVEDAIRAALTRGPVEPAVFEVIDDGYIDNDDDQPRHNGDSDDEGEPGHDRVYY